MLIKFLQNLKTFFFTNCH